MTDRTCIVDGCENTWGSRQVCPMHYERLRRSGNLPPRRPKIAACAAENCGRPVRASGWCNMHYQRLKDKGTLDGRSMRTCDVPGCEGKHFGQGFCSPHWKRVQKYGTTELPPRPAQTDIVRKQRAIINARVRDARLKAATVERFTRQEIFERDEWVCGICRLPIDQDLRWPHRFSASLDHIIPITRGGLHERANVQASHLTCNIRKRNHINT